MQKTISLADISGLLPSLAQHVRSQIEQKNRPLPSSGTRRDLLAMAALLGEFERQALADSFATGPEDAEALDRLSARVDAGGGDGTRRRMRMPERQRILTQLIEDPEAAAACVRDAQRRFGPDLNSVLATYLLNEPAQVADLPAELLPEALDAFEVLRGVPRFGDGVREAAAAAEARLEREHLLTTLRALAAGRFAGRADELSDLAAYVGDRTAEGVIPKEPMQPLLIHGPGGMGKSTLLSEFVLRDLVGPGDEPQCPFAYLDFDRRSLSIEFPGTILYEALGQLAAFYPAARERIQSIRARWRDDLRLDLQMLASALETVEFSSARHTGSFIHEFSAAVSELAPPGRPCVLILDTFEEVQSRSSDYVAELSDFIRQLGQDLASRGGCRLRVLLSGRIPVPEFDAKPYPLGRLTEPDAARFLIDLGVAPSLAPRVAKQVRGVPLTLRVAAELVRRKQDEVIARAEFDGLHPVWYDLRDDQIQALLIERYLGQIADRDVRRMAHPGLAVRRITPDIIRDVLAGPCRLDLPEPARKLERARVHRAWPGGRTPDDLFRALSREVSLVYRERDGVLRNLPDVRAVLLDLLMGDRRKAKQVRRIHFRAVAYYERFADAESRAEEIYHRLQLGQSEKVIGRRWLPGVELLLAGCLDELPPASQAILYGRLDRASELEASPARRAAIDQHAWERYAIRRAERQLKLNQPAGALATVRERPARLPGSRLFSLEVAALKHAQDWDGMRRVATLGVASAADAGNPKLAYELGRQLIQAILLAGEVAAAPAAIQAARGLAIRGDPGRSRAFQLELDLAEIRMAQAGSTRSAAVLAPTSWGPPIDPDLRRRFDEAAARLGELMSDRRAAGYGSLARLAAGVLAPVRPDCLRDVLERFGLAGVPSNLPGRRLLCRALVTWDEIVSANARRPDGVLAAAAGRSGLDQTLEDWWYQRVARYTASDDDMIRSLRARFGLPDDALRRFGELLRLPLETELFAPLHTRLLEALPANQLEEFVADELGVDLAEITKGTDRRDVVRQLLSWAYGQGRFQELVDRLAARSQAPVAA